MEWLSNMTFTIYSVGDGLFMSRVLNAIASLSNSGFFQSLGLLGLVSGLILSGFKGVATGKAEFQNIFVALLVFSIMFGGKADVIVEDVGYSPGEYAENVYPVDNVPFGVAAMGWFISNVSYGITTQLEQAYGSPSDTVASTTSNGFGRSIAWMSALKFLKEGEVSCTAETLRFCRWKQNVVNYLANCSARGYSAMPELNGTRRTTTDVWSNGGIGYASHVDSVDFLDIDSGVESTVSCFNATPILKTYSEDGSLSDDWAKISAARIGFGGQSTPAEQQEEAFGLAGFNPAVMAKFITNIALDEQMKVAVTGVPLVDQNTKLGMAMMANGSAQRADKLAQEESMFLLMMRPLMAFFESFIYIASPFMALVVGLGQFGLVTKYALTSLWVALWMPTLAAINMFQVTMMERAMSMFTNNVNADVGTHRVESLSGASAAYMEIVNWTAVGSMLAAATPAITMMLIYGTSQAAASLANSTSGAGFSNEKMTSPDIANTPAVLQRGSMQTQTASSEWVTGGATQGQFSLGAAAKNISMQSQTAMDTAMQQYSSTGSHAVAQTMSNELGSRTSATDRAGLDQKFESSNVRSLAEQAGVDTRGMSNSDLGLAMAYSEHVGADGKLGLDASKGISAGIGVKGGARLTGEQSERAGRTEQAATAIAAHAKNDQGYRISAASSVANIAESMSHDSNATRSTNENRQALSNAKMATSQASQAYQTHQSAEALAGYTQNMPNNELASHIKKTPGMSAAIGSAISQAPGGVEMARSLAAATGVKTDSATALALGGMIGLATGQIQPAGGGGAGAGLAEVNQHMREMGFGGTPMQGGGVANSTGIGSDAKAIDTSALKAEVGSGTEKSFDAGATEDKAKTGSFTVGTSGADAARENVATNVKTNGSGTQIDQEASSKTEAAQAHNQSSDKALEKAHTGNAERVYSANGLKQMQNGAADGSIADGKEFNGRPPVGGGNTEQAMGLSPGTRNENAHSGSFSDLKNQYEGGTGHGMQGSRANSDAATVLAGYAAVQMGEQLSPAQQKEVREANHRQSDVGQEATRFVANNASFSSGGSASHDSPAAIAPAIGAISGAPQVTPNERIDAGNGRGSGSAGPQKAPIEHDGTVNADGQPGDAFYGTNENASGGGPQTNLSKDRY